MIELQPAQFEQVRPLFQPLDHHLAINAVLNGIAPGKVYTDNLTAPNVTLICYKSRFYLSGEPNTAVSQALSEFFSEKVYSSGLEAFILHYTPADWEKYAPHLFGNKSPIHALRHHYEIETGTRIWQVPAGFILRLVDQNLMNETHLKNLDILMSEMQSERPSVEDFLRHSFGVCLQHDNELVGWCLSEYNTNDRCEVGIETLEPYQQRGFATLMTLALIDHAYKQTIRRVGWHCWARNAASVATALKAGFTKTADYPVYLVALLKEEN